MCYRCNRPVAEHRCPGSGWGSDITGGSFVAFGAILFVLGGAVWFRLNADAHDCSSGLVSALGPSCGNYTTWHAVGGWGALIGIVLLIIGFVKK
jgi:hypothetical protein